MAKGMNCRCARVALQVVAVLLGIPASASEPVAEMSRGGITAKLYIESKQSLGNDRWRFRTRAVFEPAEPDYVSEWQVADCKKRTFDGKPVPKPFRNTAEIGMPEVYDAICG